MMKRAVMARDDPGMAAGSVEGGERRGMCKRRLERCEEGCEESGEEAIGGELREGKLEEEKEKERVEGCCQDGEEIRKEEQRSKIRHSSDSVREKKRKKRECKREGNNG